MIGIDRSGIGEIDYNRLRETTVITVLAFRRMDTARHEWAISDTQILENLLTARLDTTGARSQERAVHLLEDPEGDVTARISDGERQAGGPCVADQDIGIECFRHRNLGFCVYHTHIMEIGMGARKKVHNTRIIEDARKSFGAIVDLVGILNRPQLDALMIKKAGIRLDRALFPLLVGVGRFGPIGVVELGDRAGRDYTTVSRQVARLETLGLVERRAGQADRRVTEAVITKKGQAINKAIDKARDRILTKILADWRPQDIETLACLLRRLADCALASS